MPGQESAEMLFASEVGSLAFDLQVKAEFYEKGTAKIEHLPPTEAAVHALMSRLFSDGSRALHALALRYPNTTNVGIDQIVSLPARAFEISSLDQWLRAALSGEVSEIELGAWRFDYPASPMRFVCQSVAFEEGSLSSWFKGFASGGALVAALAGTPQLANAYSDYQLSKTLSGTYSEQECVSTGTITVTADALYAVTASQFNYRGKLADDERVVRACHTQLAISLDGIDVGPIDGDPKDRTERGLREFQKKHNLVSADVNDPAVQIELSKAMKRGLDALKK